MNTVRHLTDIPETAIPVSVMEIVSYLNADGSSEWALRVGGETHLSTLLGLMELAKASLLREELD